MLKFMLSLLLVVLIIAVCGFGLLYVFQRKLLYPAPGGVVPTQFPPGVEKHEFEAGYSFYIPPPAPVTQPVPAIVFAHGNGEWASQWIEPFTELASHGIAVLLVEFPGYAGAPGKPSLDAMRKLMLDGHDLLLGKDEVDPQRIIAHGRSLGGGAACLLAESRPVAALVLESTFTTLQKLVGELRYPSAFLMDKYDNEGVVRQFDRPVLIYHGRQDELIGVHHAEALHAAAMQSELVLRDCDHNSCPRPWKELLGFLENHGIMKPAADFTDQTSFEESNLDEPNLEEPNLEEPTRRSQGG